MFRAIMRMRWYIPIAPHPGHRQTASSALYTTRCKHSLVLLRLGEIIARNMLNWLKLLIKLSLLHLVGCLCYCTRTIFHKVLRWIVNWWECGRKSSCPSLLWYFHMCLEEKGSHCSGWEDPDLNKGLTAYETGVLLTWPVRPYLF